MADEVRDTTLHAGDVDDADHVDGGDGGDGGVDGGDASEAADERTIARKAASEVERRKTRLIGVGLLVSLVIGFGPLRDALVGNGSFEGALGRYLLCLGFSVGAMLTLGKVLETAPAPEGDGAGPSTAARPDLDR